MIANSFVSSLIEVIKRPTTKRDRGKIRQRMTASAFEALFSKVQCFYRSFSKTVVIIMFASVRLSLYVCRMMVCTSF